MLPTLTYLRDSHVLRGRRQNCTYFSRIFSVSRIEENNKENTGIISEKHEKIARRCRECEKYMTFDKKKLEK